MEFVVGQIVLYKIGEHDARKGNQSDIGNLVPAIVTRIWPNEYGTEAGYNITVFPDGEQTLWRTSVKIGFDPGQIQAKD